jgi:hypothetical protein
MSCLLMNRNALDALITGLSFVASSSLFAGPGSAGVSVIVVLQLCRGALAGISGAILICSTF